MTIDCEAWFIHKRPSGDTSVYVSLFTEERGIVSCLYKGGRTPKKLHALQPFMPLWAAIDQRSDWFYIRKLESQASALFFKQTALFAALYLNELIYYALKPLDPHPKLYHSYQYTLKGLSTTTDRLVIEALLRKFEWVLLDECGYGLSINAIEGDKHYRFIAGKGFLLADRGLAGSDILAMGDGQFDSISVLKTAKLIMREAIAHLLDGRELKSRSLFISG